MNAELDIDDNVHTNHAKLTARISNPKISKRQIFKVCASQISKKKSNQLSWEKLTKFSCLKINIRFDEMKTQETQFTEDGVVNSRKVKTIAIQIEDLKSKTNWDNAGKTLKFKTVRQQPPLTNDDGYPILNSGRSEKAEIQELENATDQKNSKFTSEGINRATQMDDKWWEKLISSFTEHAKNKINIRKSCGKDGVYSSAIREAFRATHQNSFQLAQDSIVGQILEPAD